MFANDFFANANNIPLPDFSYNRWGGTGRRGPIIRQQRTFFMYGHEGIHEARPRNNGTPTVPTEKMRNGDFSELLALGPQYQIYNPFTRRVDRRRALPAGSVPGQHHPAEPDQPGRASDPRLHRHAEDAPATPTARGNFQQPGAQGGDRVRARTRSASTTS